MIIGYDAKRLFNNLTGLGNYSRTLVGNIEKEAKNNTYILYSEKFRQNPDTEQFLDSTKFRCVTKKGFLRKLWRIYSINSDIKKDKVDIYHGLSHDLPFGSKVKGCKYVVTIHDVCFKTFPKMFAPFERLIYHFKYKNSLKKADKIVAISQSTKNDIIKFYPKIDPNKIEVIYQALNPVYYNLADKAECAEVVAKYGVKGDYILYVGSINSRKNLLGLVRAYSYLDESHRLPLVVIGTGRQCKEEVVNYCRKNDLDQYVTYLDNLTLPENLQAFYRCAKMLVYPSFYEGFGLPVGEALLSETPVITSNISSLPEAGGEFAIYADPYDEKDIAKAISKVNDNQEWAKGLAKSGREFCIKNFDTKVLTEQMLNLYKQLPR